jgi:hypothetical protein
VRKLLQAHLNTHTPLNRKLADGPHLQQSAEMQWLTDETSASPTPLETSSTARIFDDMGYFPRPDVVTPSP